MSFILKINPWKYAETLLGGFVAASGFGISLFNLRSLLKKRRSVSSILLSENLLLTLLGVAYIVRSQQEFAPTNSENKMRSLQQTSTEEQQMECNFQKILITYGPFILSVVNSFVSLMINNYIRYQVAEEQCRNKEENTVREIDEEAMCKKPITFVKKHFKFFASLIQWSVPIIAAASMYTINVKEMFMQYNGKGSDTQSCETMLDMAKMNCSLQIGLNSTIELRHYVLGEYVNVAENSGNNITEFQAVVERVYDIVNNFRPSNFSTESYYALQDRNSKFIANYLEGQTCLKMCYVDTKTLLVYLFCLMLVACLIPIIISIVLLTKLHSMDVKGPVKKQVRKELLLNVLFWTPIVLDNFLSLILCSYDMGSNRTSVVTIVANVYQVVRNFLNTKHFHRNNVLPV